MPKIGVIDLRVGLIQCHYYFVMVNDEIIKKSGKSIELTRVRDDH